MQHAKSVHNRFEIRDLTKLFQRSLSASRWQGLRRIFCCIPKQMTAHG